LRPEVDKAQIDRGMVDPETVTSQVQLILSRDLARDVIKDLNLTEVPEFNAALKLLQSALKEGLTDKSDQVQARKHSAFSLCLLRRFTQCRGEFTKIFEIDPGFDLSPAEAGHPSWAKTYAGVKQRATEAKEKAAKGAVKKK